MFPGFFPRLPCEFSAYFMLYAQIKVLVTFLLSYFFVCLIIARCPQGQLPRKQVEKLRTGVPDLPKPVRTTLNLRKTEFQESICLRTAEKNQRVLACERTNPMNRFKKKNRLKNNFPDILTWIGEFRPGNKTIGVVSHRIRIFRSQGSVFASRPSSSGKTSPKQLIC